MPAAITPLKADRERQNWARAIEQLLKQVESWAKDRKWSVRRDGKQIHEPQFGTYSVPVLDILAPAGQLHVDPIARYIAGGDGRVDLVAWPSLTRMLLIRVGKCWVLKTDSGIEWPEAWSRQSFERLVGLLNAST